MEEEFIKEMANRRGVPIIREQSHVVLEDIVEKYQPKNILEIGTAVGYSGIIMLKASQNANLITIEHDQNKVDEAKINFENEGLSDRVNVVCDDCMQYVSLMVAEGNYDKYFDFIFLDGPKAQYVKMLDSLLMLCKDGGIILADNVLFRGYVKDKSLMPRRFKTIVKRLNMFFEAVKTNEDIESSELIEIEDGMLFIKKKEK